MLNVMTVEKIIRPVLNTWTEIALDCVMAGHGSRRTLASEVSQDMMAVCVSSLLKQTYTVD